MSNIVKGKKAIDAVQLYQFFSDFALEEEKEEISGMEESAEEEISKERVDPLAAVEAAERERASEILNEAHKEAEQILADARRQAELLREEAFGQGHEEGIAAGREEARQECEARYEEELQAFKKNAADFMDSIRREKNVLIEKHIEDLKRIVLAIAEKVIHTSLKSSENVIHRMIIAATDKLKKTEWAKIYITKCDAEISLETDVEFLNALSHLSDSVKIVAMDTEEEGICIVELPEEIIDASVSTQLENIKDILNNARI